MNTHPLKPSINDLCLLRLKRFQPPTIGADLGRAGPAHIAFTGYSAPEGREQVLLPPEIYERILSYVPTRLLPYIGGSGTSLPSTFLPLVAQREYGMRREHARKLLCAGPTNSPECLEAFQKAAQEQDAATVRKMCLLKRILPGAQGWPTQSDYSRNLVPSVPRPQLMDTLLALLDCNALSISRDGILTERLYSLALEYAREGLPAARATAEMIIKRLFATGVQWPDVPMSSKAPPWVSMSPYSFENPILLVVRDALLTGGDSYRKSNLDSLLQMGYASAPAYVETESGRKIGPPHTLQETETWLLSPEGGGTMGRQLPDIIWRIQGANVGLGPGRPT